MKRFSCKAILSVATMFIVVMLLFTGITGCKSTTAATSEHSQWTLKLEGVRTEDIDQAAFEAGAKQGCHGVKWTDADGQVWEGIPLWLLVGRVDNLNIEHGTGAFDDTLADKGYHIQVVGSGDNSVTFTSSEVKRNENIIVSYRLNGQPLPDNQWPLELVGSAVASQNRIGMITAIKLILSPVVSSTTSNETGDQGTGSPPESAQPAVVQTELDELIGLAHSDPAYVDNSELPVTPVGLLHITGTAHEVDITKYTLTVDGLVENPLTLSYEDLLQYPATTQTVLLICQSVFVDNASWTGVPLATLLAAARVTDQAKEVTFHTLDGYAAIISLKDAQSDGAFLAYQVDGQTLPKEHGYPLRLVLKGLYGGQWVKWVDHIEIK